MDLHSVVPLHTFANVISNAADKENHFQLQKLSRQCNKIAVPPSPQNDGKMNRSRIGYVSFPYRSRIVLLSFSYRSRFRKRKQYGNDTETIEEAREKQGRMLPTQNIFKFLKLYNYGKTQWYFNQTPGISR